MASDGRLPRWLVTDFEDPGEVLERVRRLRGRGFGARVIARVVFGEHIRMGYVSYAAAVKRVQRLLRLLDGDGLGRRGHSVDIFHGKPVHKGSESVESAYSVIQKRLGRTERLVLQVLSVSSELGLKDIYEYLRVHGVSYRAVYMALYRLLRRGIVGRTYYHTYYLRARPIDDDIFVENARSGEFILYSKKDNGRPARLREFLVLASRGLWLGLSQVELSSYTYNRVLDRLYRELRRRGWGFTVIYYDEYAGSLKLEHRFWAPDTPPHISFYNEYRRLYAKATQLARIVVESIHSRLGLGKMSTA